MLFRFPPRVIGLAIGVGALVAGLVMALLGLVFGTGYVGLVAAGFAIAVIGAVVAIVGAIGFAIHGAAKPRSGQPLGNGRLASASSRRSAPGRRFRL